MKTLLSLVAASRAYGLRTAIVARLKAEYPEVQVKAWPGKLDVQNMVDRTSIAPPAILVAVTGQRAPDDMMAGQHHEPVEFTAYVVTENRPLGPAGPQRQVFSGDEIGLALCNDLLLFLATDGARWAIDDVGHPDEPRAQPVLTLAGLEQGTAFFAVMWRQTVYGQGTQRGPALEGPLPPPPLFAPGFSPPGSDLVIGDPAAAPGAEP